MKTATKVIFLLLLLSMAASARRRDPLTEAEADQLRELALVPSKRLALLSKFAEARLLAIDQIRVDSKLGAERGKLIHDRLEDFAGILDEINDNVDQYEAKQFGKDFEKDFHKGLKALVETTDRLNLKLQALKTATETDPEARREAPDYRFVLQDAIEALKSTADVARESLETTHDQKGADKKK